MSESITVGIVNYNGMNILGDTIRSLKSLDYPIERIIMADDGSTDGSVDYIKQNFPDVEIIQLSYNTKKANLLRNVLLKNAETRLVLLVDNDVTFNSNCLSELVSNINRLPDAAVCTARVMTKEDKRRIYSDGNVLHYLCNSIAENRDSEVASKDDLPKISIGCIGNQLVDKEKAQLVGFHDEEMAIGWGDDGEFHHRLLMVGMRCYLIPKAIVYHRKKTKGFRTVAQVKNRAYFIIKNYSLRTILLIFPALLVYEIAILVFLFAKNDLGSYYYSILDVIHNFKKILVKRRMIQKIRVVSDKQVMQSGPIYMAPYLLEKKLLRWGFVVLNFFFDSYWKAVKTFI